MTSVAARPGRVWGGTAHRVYSVVVFMVLASLDNVAIGLVPPLYTPIAEALGVGEGAIGVVTAASYLVTAVAAVGWAYVGDRTNRKPLLMIGTLLWAAGTGGTVLAGGYAAFFAAQILAAVGLGAVGSVGFSVVSDLISPRRRGLVMSFWGLSQGVGTLAGTLRGRPARRRRLAPPVLRPRRGRGRGHARVPVHLQHPPRAERAGAGRGCSPPAGSTSTGSAAPTCPASCAGGPTSG